MKVFYPLSSRCKIKIKLMQSLENLEDQFGQGSYIFLFLTWSENKTNVKHACKRHIYGVRDIKYTTFLSNFYLWCSRAYWPNYSLSPKVEFCNASSSNKVLVGEWIWMDFQISLLLWELQVISDWLCVRDITKTSFNRLLLLLILKSSHQSCSVEKGALKNFTGKHLC